MYFFYTSALYLLVPLVLVRLLWLGKKNPAYHLRWRERFGYVTGLEGNKPIIWIHAVSVGEIQASRPLVEYLNQHYPDYQILVTTVTPTGAATAAQIYGGIIQHRYFPYDLPGAVKRFLATVNPVILLILETEIWPNLYRQCRAADIPVLLLNARLSERSLRGYRLLKSLTQQTLQDTRCIAAQSTADAKRFIEAGAPADRVMVMGNLKFDISIAASVVEQGVVIRQKFMVNRPIWIAASTHQGEESLLLDALTIVRQNLPDSLLVIAPRHPERFQSVIDLCVKRGFHTVSYTQQDSYDPNAQVFVLDTLGQLLMYYAAADIAFVGGSLVPVGGHNMLEPACLGLPVLTGSYLFNFTEIASLLANVDALIQVTSAEQLASKVLELFSDGNQRYNMGLRAKQVVLENQGSINKVDRLLKQYL